MVAFIAAIPSKVKIQTEYGKSIRTLYIDFSYRVVKKVADISFLCVKKSLRFKGLALILIQEITKRLELEGTFQDALYTSVRSHLTIFSEAAIRLRYLNPKKMAHSGFATLGINEDMTHYVRRHALTLEVSLFVRHHSLIRLAFLAFLEIIIW